MITRLENGVLVFTPDPDTCAICRRHGPDIRTYRRKGVWMMKRLCRYCRTPLDAEWEEAQREKKRLQLERLDARRRRWSRDH